MDTDQTADLTERFAAAMDRLGPFEPSPRLALAVSGGADSMALAWLASDWARRRGGTVLALTVDHGLRREASVEADITIHLLASLGIDGRALTLAGLWRGPALAERAREARYAALYDACAAAGIPHLLLGHHRGDQVETVMQRALSGSASRGLAGMPGLAETGPVRLLRPLLRFAPGELRALLRDLAIDWVEDPSNRDPAASRSRLRALRDDPAGDSESTLAVARAASRAGTNRTQQDRRVAAMLAERATIRPEGYALLTPGPIDPDALAALLCCIAGAAFRPPIDRVAVLARAIAPATIGGVRISHAGRLGSGWLLTRERRAMGPPAPAHPNSVWDDRFRLAGWPVDGLIPGLSIDALGNDTASFRRRDRPPAAVLHGLPALRQGGRIVAIPHIGFGAAEWQFLFDPRNRAAGAPFHTGDDGAGCSV